MLDINDIYIVILYINTKHLNSYLNLNYNYQPFYHMYYDPFVYNLDTFYLPTFYAYATPYVIVNSSGYHVI